MTALVQRLRALAADKSLAIGEAWNALDEAADAIERCAVIEKINAQLVDDLQASEKWRETLAAELQRARRVIVRLMDPSGLGAMDEARAYLAEREKEAGK